MIIPRMKFAGADAARQMSRIFAENVHDLISKVDSGGNKPFEPGFFHTSTVQHEGTCYYKDMWSRDAGRGLIELCRLGFSDDAMLVSRYFLNHINYEDHWGRIVSNGSNKKELLDIRMKYETDGNAMARRVGHISDIIGRLKNDGMVAHLDFVATNEAGRPGDGDVGGEARLGGGVDRRRCDA